MILLYTTITITINMIYTRPLSSREVDDTPSEAEEKACGCCQNRMGDSRYDGPTSCIDTRILVNQQAVVGTWDELFILCGE